MNPATIWRLVLKDWHLHRIPVLLTVAGSVIAVLLLLVADKRLTPIGINLAIAVLITVTFYLPLSGVLEERGQRTITFLMSLPISTSEYVASKIVSNLSLFLLPWLTTVLGTQLVSSQTDIAAVHSGWVPVALLGMVTSFCLVLAFALITESGGWTVALTILLLFLFGNVLTQALPGLPAAAQVMKSIDARGPAFHATLMVEALLIVLVLGICFIVQSRKRDFL